MIKAKFYVLLMFFIFQHNCIIDGSQLFGRPPTMSNNIIYMYIIELSDMSKYIGFSQNSK